MSRLVKLLLVGVVVFLVFRAITSGYTSSENSDAPDDISKTQPGATSDPVEVENDKAEIDKAVKLFVKSYYRRDEQLFDGGFTEADSRFSELLEPIVTPDFLDTYVTSLDIPQNQGFVNGVYSQKARVSNMSYHGHIEGEEADRQATVAITWFKLGEPLEKRKSDVEFLLEKFDGAWRVSGCTCDT